MSESIKSGHLPVESPWRYKLAGIITAPLYAGSRVYGLDNLPGDDEPYFLAAGHRSYLDTPLIGRTLLKHDGTEGHFVVKRELTDLPVIGSYIIKAGGIRFDRDKPMIEQPEVGTALRNVTSDNGVAVVFPEATRREGIELQIDKPGLGATAARYGAKIAVAGLFGTEKLLARRVLVFGETTDTTEIVDGEVRRKKAKDVEEEYTGKLQKAMYAAAAFAGRADLLPDSYLESMGL